MKLKIWRKVITAAHPITAAFKEMLQEQMGGHFRKAPSGSRTGDGCEKYESFAARFMLVAMRARQRVGEVIAIDDVIYSSSIVKSFFRCLLDSGVSVATCVGFAKALTSLHKFVDRHMLSNGGCKRKQDIASAEAVILYESQMLMCGMKKSHTFAGIRAKPKAKEGASYCVTRAIVQHEKVDKEIGAIMADFKITGKLRVRDYNFVMG